MDPHALFIPYVLQEQWPGRLQAQLHSVQKWLNVFLLRITPLFLFAMIPNAVALGWRDFPWFAYPIFVFLLALAAYMATREIITGFAWSNTGLEVTNNHFFGSRTTFIPKEEIECLEVLIEKGSRGGRTWYQVHKKDGTKKAFAVFPIGLKLDNALLKARNDYFSELTKLPLKQQENYSAFL
jgi:hypothetical protein